MASPVAMAHRGRKLGSVVMRLPVVVSLASSDLLLVAPGQWWCGEHCRRDGRGGVGYGGGWLRRRGGVGWADGHGGAERKWRSKHRARGGDERIGSLDERRV